RWPNVSTRPWPRSARAAEVPDPPTPKWPNVNNRVGPPGRVEGRFSQNMETPETRGVPRFSGCRGTPWLVTDRGEPQNDHTDHTHHGECDGDSGVGGPMAGCLQSAGYRGGHDTGDDGEPAGEPGQMGQLEPHHTEEEEPEHRPVQPDHGKGPVRANQTVVTRQGQGRHGHEEGEPPKTPHVPVGGGVDADPQIGEPEQVQRG